jgi:hypothetical protein
MDVRAIIRGLVVIAPIAAIAAALQHIWFWAVTFAIMAVAAPLALFRWRNARDV